MKSRVHPTYKTKYHVRHWASYDRALVRRGDITVWLSPAAIATWDPDGAGTRGAQRKYSDLAIESVLTLRLLFHLPLRQAEGFLTSLFVLMELDLRSPDHTTLSRRGQHLDCTLRGVPRAQAFISSSTARACRLSARGMGGCETWRPGHARVEETPCGCRSNRCDRRSRSHRTTVDDATTGVELIEAVSADIARVTADAAYDTIAFYETATARGATVVVPPDTTARVSRRRPRSSARHRTIEAVKQMGRRRWKQAAGYHRQARVETAFFRYTSIFWGALRARRPGGPVTEVLVACNVLNQMTDLGRPDSYAVGR